MRWMYSTNAKDIGTLYIMFAMMAGVVGTSMSMVMRMELGGVGENLIKDAQTYNIMITAHGFVMIFFMLMPALLGGFGKLNCECIIKGGYLAGLIEGDGSIIVPVKKGSNPNIKIAFNGKDKGLAERMREESGWGEIDKGNGNYYLWQIRRYKDIEELIEKINGKMRTPKREALKRLIDHMNEKLGLSIRLKKEDESEIGSNGWLSGMLDADGNFYVVIQEQRGKAARIRGYCRLELRRNYHREGLEGKETYMEIMMKISEYLGVNVIGRRRAKEEKRYESYIVMTSSELSRETLNKYLDEYPLRSSKYWDYKDWKEILRIVKEGEHKKEEGLKRCKELKKGMNKGRTEKSWRHLQKKLPV